MCGTTDKKGAGALGLAVGLLGVVSIGLMVSTIVLATKMKKETVTDTVFMPQSQTLSNVPGDTIPGYSVFKSTANQCEGRNFKKGEGFDNLDCIHTDPNLGPQAGGNVTKGFKGQMETVSVPVTVDFSETPMCTVNVHWHLGTEHYSLGQYDENGDGPNGKGEIPANYNSRKLSGSSTRGGFRCHHYDKNDAKFTTKYDWKHCVDMEVGESYEVHWPHSAAGACGTVDQYQTPFEDGVLCNEAAVNQVLDGSIMMAFAIGVQAQVFTIVNDEKYFYPDLIRGWIRDGKTYGYDVAKYTGSTTGTSRSNDVCSAYSPITWQVDRTCHMISASSFDKLCYDMKQIKDDMSGDLHPHGSRELVKPSLMANNQEDRRALRADK